MIQSIRRLAPAFTAVVVALASTSAPRAARAAADRLPMAALFKTADGGDGVAVVSPPSSPERTFMFRYATGDIRGLKRTSDNAFQFGPALGQPDPAVGRLEFAMDPTPFASVRLTVEGEGAVDAQRVAVGEESVTFSNGPVRLSGTLLIPPGHGPFPAIVLTHGSGKETRDAGLGPALMFVELGFAALVYDKRGCGKSTGADWRASFGDYADDALAGVRMLKKRPDVRADAVGVWGHSQGSWIAPLAAQRGSADVAFVVAECGGVVDPITQEVFRGRESFRLKLSGKFSPAQIDASAAYRRVKYEFASTGKGERRYKAATEKARSQPWFRNVTEKLPDRVFWKANGGYDPAATLAALRVPTLIILAEFDTMTPTAASAATLRDTKALADNANLTSITIRGANHGLFESKGGMIFEDEEGRATRIAPEYLKSLRLWLAERVKAGRP